MGFGSQFANERLNTRVTLSSCGCLYIEVCLRNFRRCVNERAQWKREVILAQHCQLQSLIGATTCHAQVLATSVPASGDEALMHKGGLRRLASDLLELR